MGLMLISSVMLARILGPENFGELTYIMSIVAILTIPVALGLPNYLTREVSKNLVLDNTSQIRLLLKNATFLVVTSSLLVICIVAISVWILDTDITTPLLIASTSLFLLGFNQVRMGILKGYHEIIKSQIPEKAIMPFFYVLFLAIGYLLVEDKMSVTFIICLHLISLAVAFLFGVYYLKKYVLQNLPVVNNHDDDSTLKPMLIALFPFSLLAGLQAINQNIDFVILGALSENQSEVAFFKIAFTISMLTFVIATIVNSVINPRISELYTKKDFKQLQKFIAIGSAIAFSITTVISVFFIFFGEKLISFFYGVEYIETVPLLIVLLFQKIFITFFGPVHAILQMTGYESNLWKINLIFVAARIVLDFILILNFGAMGAVIGMFITTAIHVIILWLLIKKELSINSNVTSILKIRN